MKKIIVIAGSIVLAICICISTLLFMKDRSWAGASSGEEVRSEEYQEVIDYIMAESELRDKEITDFDTYKGIVYREIT